jgi:uncharacterized protein (UPF0332 family)
VSASPFARNLARKSQRALRSARLGLEDGDSDGAVNRAYYAMFNIARAALLSGGVPEEGLPVAHKELIAAFRQYAVQTGQIDRDLAGALSRSQALCAQADDGRTELDAKAAADAVQRAESFVLTIERMFALQGAGKSGDVEV